MYKYLSCIIQDNVKWAEHIESQTKKCNKRMFLLRQLNNLRVDSNILALYYNSMIASVLTYVISSWYSSCNKTTLSELFRVEKRALRVINKQCHPKLLTPEKVCQDAALSSTKKMMADEDHPLHTHFEYLPHGIRLKMPSCRTEVADSLLCPPLSN